MVDLEDEFKSLIESLYTEIRRKQVNGDLTRDEADELTRMVSDRVSFPNTDDSWCSSHGWTSSTEECFG